MSDELPKWKQVVRAVKDQIVSGAWKAGEKLPTYDELEIRFRVSRLTLQQVMRALKTEGFVLARERQGIFVNPRHPFLCRIGILFPYEEGFCTRFWQGLLDAARQICCAQGRELAVYWNLSKSSEELSRLISDIEESRLAGLILPVSPDFGDLQNILKGHPELPLVSAGEFFPRLAWECRIVLDNRALVCRALDFMQKRSCRKIPVMLNGRDSEIAQTFQEEVRKRGLYSPPAWNFVFRMEVAELAEQITALLLSLPEKERPDGIFIGDDNLTSHVVRGAVEKGVRLPGEFTIVSHYNWLPQAVDSLPVCNIGYDIRDIVERAVRKIDEFRVSGRMEPQIYVSPLFREELADSDPQKRERKYA